MDPNGNLNYAERRALRPGDWVVFQTEATAHRGEQRGRVHHVGESGIVWLGTTGSQYALTTDYVAMADWPRADAPEADVSASEKREEFLRDIEPTREMVAKWPAWKRNALGPVPAAPDFPPVAAPEAARDFEDGIEGLRKLEREHGHFAGIDATAWVRELRGEPVCGTPEAARGVEAPEAGKDTGGTPDAPEGQETGSVEALQAQVAALTLERDEAGRVLRTLADTLHDLAKVIEEEVLK